MAMLILRKHPEVLSSIPGTAQLRFYFSSLFPLHSDKIPFSQHS